MNVVTIVLFALALAVAFVAVTVSLTRRMVARVGRRRPARAWSWRIAGWLAWGYLVLGLPGPRVLLGRWTEAHTAPAWLLPVLGAAVGAVLGLVAWAAMGVTEYGDRVALRFLAVLSAVYAAANLAAVPSEPASGGVF